MLLYDFLATVTLEVFARLEFERAMKGHGAEYQAPGFSSWCQPSCPATLAERIRRGRSARGFGAVENGKVHSL